MKIRSGLPYDEAVLSKVYDEGAVVNLAKVKFPTVKGVYDNMKAAITYLRNTDYDVTFDFSEMDYEQKSALLKAYLDTNVAYDIPELDNTWIKIFYACAYIDLDIENEILNDLEIRCFISNEREYLIKWADFIISLPLYLILRLKVDLDISDLEVREEKVNVTNFLNILKRPEFEQVMFMSGNVKPKNYINVFTLENNELFETLAATGFNVVLTGMVSENPEEFVEFLKRLTFGEIKEECQ